MSNTFTYTCPSCGAGVSFDAEKQAFCCPFCSSEFTKEELSSEESLKQSAQRQRENEAFCDAMREYRCPSCGAEVLSDETTAADFCCYCHNPIVLVGKLSGQLRPHKVIPFRFDKKAAEAQFSAFVKKKKFLPNDFFAPEQRERIQGIYYPFWMVDADTESTLDAEATRVRSWRMGNYRYTETSYFDVDRTGEIHFEDLVTSALSTADKRMLEGVLPYPVEAPIDFDMAYLSGFLAKKRDIEREVILPEVHARMQEYATTLLQQTVQGYTTVRPRGSKVKVNRIRFDYTLMPLWMLTYRDRKGRPFVYAMNGYTGKIYGELPISRPKLLSLFAGLLAGVGGVLSLILGVIL